MRAPKKDESDACTDDPIFVGFPALAQQTAARRSGRGGSARYHQTVGKSGKLKIKIKN